ncbi:hypothetical protein MHBO_004682, partial [Bonamia ostreae]
EEAGTFSKKGEIVDVYPINGNPIRLYYFDDMMEEIYPIDLNDHKTIRTAAIET